MFNISDCLVESSIVDFFKTNYGKIQQSKGRKHVFIHDNTNLTILLITLYKTGKNWQRKHERERDVVILIILRLNTSSVLNSLFVVRSLFQNTTLAFRNIKCNWAIPFKSIFSIANIKYFF